MALSVKSLLVTVDESSDGLNSASFRANIESQLEYIKKSDEVSSLAMTDGEHNIYEGDLAGWLIANGYREDYHWIIARLNGYNNAYEYEGIKRVFRIPSITYVNSLLRKHQQRLG